MNELSIFLLVDLFLSIFLNALEISPFLAPLSTLKSDTVSKDLFEIAYRALNAVGLGMIADFSDEFADACHQFLDGPLI